jgi:hypothetical protein
MSNFQNNGATDAPLNKVGLAGFVCALVGSGTALVMSLVVAILRDGIYQYETVLHVLSYFISIVSLLGLILSIVGLFKKPRGLAIDGIFKKIDEQWYLTDAFYAICED